MTTYTLEVVIPIPFPSVGLPNLSIKFPPSIPGLPLNLGLDGLATIEAILRKIQVAIIKLVNKIPGLAIHLVVKLGKTTILDVTVSSP